MILIAMDRAQRPHVEGYAIDRASARRYDEDGHLHVASNTLTKANICEYYGWEIPGYEALGLDARKLYRMFRDPEELAKAVDTFNGKPVLVTHQPVTADEFPEELIGGTTGTEAAFDGEYIRNSISLWTRDAIEGVEKQKRRELSSGYRYTADMTPGTFQGLPYHGVMRDIRCNHIALVVEGRAGPDVLVGDEGMKSRKALMIAGAVSAYLAPKLAKDGKVDLKPVFGDVTATSIAMDGAPAKLAIKIADAAKPALAADQTIDTDALAAAIETAASAMALDGADEIAEPTEAKPEIKPETKPEAKPAPVAGMDAAAVQKLIDDAKAEVRAEAIAMDTARRAVHPHVGDVTAETADAVYKIALDAAVKNDTLDAAKLASAPASAYAAMVSMLPDPNAAPVIAQDHRQPGNSKLASIVPNLQPLKVG